MLFAPSQEGISHSEKESTTDADMLIGIDMHTGVLERLITGELVK